MVKCEKCKTWPKPLTVKTVFNKLIKKDMDTYWIACADCQVCNAKKVVCLCAIDIEDNNVDICRTCIELFFKKWDDGERDNC